MKSLEHLVHCLKPSEVQFVKDFYKVKFNAKKNKRLQLFELILKKKVRSNKEACQEIYHHHTDSAFCHLKKRLEEDLLNFMLMTPNCTDNPDQTTKEEIQGRKIFLQGKVLLSRGMQEEGISLIRKTSKLAEQFEFPDLKLASLEILRKYQLSNQVLKPQKYYKDQMDKALNVYHKIIKAKHLNYPMLQSSKLTNSSKGSETGPLIKDMESDYQPGESKKAYFWYEMALIEEHIRENNHQAAKNHALQLVEYIQMEPVLNCPQKKAEVNLRLAKSLIQLKEFHRAIEPAEKALNWYPRHDIKSLLALQVLFFAYYRSEEFESADHILSQAFNHKCIKDQCAEKWHLLQAALTFTEGKYCEVSKKLNCVKQFKKVGISWSIGHHLLELINILELEDFDWFEYKIDSFRKKLSSVKSDVCPRLPRIYSLLKALISTNYHYRLTAKAQKKNLIYLQQGHWDPMGYELINIGHWLNTKAVNLNT